MYGRQQPPQAYPRQYGNAYPAQPPPTAQHQYPPQQYPQQGGYPPQQHPQRGGYPTQQQPQQGGYPPQQYPQHPQYGNRQQPPQQQQPPYGGQYGAQAQPRGPFGRQATPAPTAGPPAMPMVRGSLPYGARSNTSVVSSYESQAQKWKKGFTAVPAAAASGGGSRQSDVEAPLIAELCSSAGSSYPPRDVLQKLLRHLSSIDHEYVCELLDDKLEDRVWQVQGKALSVLDTLFKSQEAELYKNHYYQRIHVLEALCNSRKELLKARAEKVYNVIKSHVPPAPPSPEVTQQPEVQQEVQSYAQTHPPTAALAPEVNLLGSPLLMAQEEPTEAPPSSAFGFLNSSVETPSTPVGADAGQEGAAPVSAFSFLSSQSTTPSQSAEPSPPITRVVAVTPVAAPTHDIFSALPPPMPVIGLVTQVEEPAPAPPVEEEPKVHDPIHDAFEGLSFGDEGDGEETPNDENPENPLEGFKTGSSGTMGTASTTANYVHAPVIKVDPNDRVREIILEIDVPAGPMGLMLDRSVPDMAIVQGFLRMPTGERGYLELHPVLCPGCALVSINSINVEDKGLEEIGAILGSLINSYKMLRFKKLMRGGRTVNPANPDTVYTPPPPEKEEDPQPNGEEEGADEVVMEPGEDQFMERLLQYSNQLDGIEKQIDDIVQRDRSNLPVGDLKNQLAQLHGTVEKIQTQGIDAVILGANPPANADEIRQLRSSLVCRSDEITKRIQKIAANGTAPSPLVAPIVVGSPEVSAFSFVVGADGQEALPSMPPLQLPEPVVAPPPSGFSFMQSSASPASSPQGPGPSGSAFSFLSGGDTPPVPPVQSSPVVENSVFAGLSVRGAEPEAPSAFGFLSGTANSSATPVGVVDPPRVASPTAFSFLRGGTVSPPSSPAAAGRGGSAFSFIS